MPSATGNGVVVQNAIAVGVDPRAVVGDDEGGTGGHAGHGRARWEEGDEDKGEYDCELPQRGNLPKDLL